MTERNWTDVRPGWHEIIIQLNEYNPHQHRIDILEWLDEHIDMPQRHCVYTWTDKVVKIKFRYQRDYVFARLRW
jgi:hypothetical protein